LPQFLGAPGALSEEREHLVGGEVDREGAEPDLETGIGGMSCGDAQTPRVVSGNADGIAVQLTGNYCNVTPDRIGGERPAREFFPR